MGMFSLSIAPRITLRQTAAFLQRQSADIMRMPPETLDNLITDLFNNPGKYERELTDNNRGNGNDSKTQSFFPILTEARNLGKGGVITNADLSKFASPGTIEEGVDGLYISRGNDASSEKPEFIASKLLEPFAHAMLALKIPKEYGKARNLFNYLINERNWIVKNLRRIYGFVGENQREYINSLNPARTNNFGVGALADALGLSITSASRLVNGRKVAIKHGDENYAFSTRDLVVSPYKFFTYTKVAGLTSALSQESKTGVALSDEQLAKETGVARRTITKYRADYRIPSSKARQESYNTGRQERYPIVTNLGEIPVSN